MKKWIGSLVMALMGWKLDHSVDVKSIKKCVLACAPHTSNWDFILAVSAFWKMGIPMKLFIKDSWTKPWYGFIIKWLGGIGIDRSSRKNMTGYAADLIKKSDELFMLNTPEGSRSYAEKWKKGFYYIAKEADVPILLGYADYKKKVAGVGKLINHKNKELDEVFTEIESFYKGVHGKHPENFNPKIF